MKLAPKYKTFIEEGVFESIICKHPQFVNETVG